VGHVVNYSARMAEIKAQPGLSNKERSKRISRLPRNNNWIVRYSVWWGADRLNATETYLDPQADLALVKLSGWDAGLVQGYATFKRPETTERAGTSLCRLGFPFHHIESTWEE